MAFPTLDDDAIVTRVRRLINEPTAFIHSDDDLTEWYDLGAQVLAQTTLGYEEANEYFQLATDDRDYTYSTIFTTPDCIRIESLIYLGDSSLESSSQTKALVKIPPRLWRQLDDTETGVPKYWTDFNETVYVWPTPTSSENSDYVQVWYYKMYTDLSGSTDATSLPEWMQEYPIWYAVAKAFERERKYAQAQQYLSYFRSFVMFHRQDRLFKPVDSEDMMRLPDNTQYV